MMSPTFLLRNIVRPTCAWLAEQWTVTYSSRVDQMMVAIALQESALQHRMQLGGPARGFWQFELVAVRDVMQRRTRAALGVCERLVVPADPTHIHTVIAWNDILACAVARLFLHLDPPPLPEPTADGMNEGFECYLRTWRPGAWVRGTDTQRADIQRRWSRAWDAALSSRAELG